MKMWRNEQRKKQRQQQHHQTPKTLPRFLSLAYCGLGSLTANSSARIVFASCLPETVCVLCPCLCDIFPLQFSLSHSLCSLARSLQGSFLPTCLPTWQFHNVPPNMWGSLSPPLSLSLSLLLIHMNALTHVQQHVVRSQQLRTGRPYWCVRVSERACQNERAEWEQKQQQQRESELCSAQLWAQPSVASTQRRGEYEKGSLSRWHICVVSVAFVRLELLFGFCVCTADRDACGLLAQQYYKHIHIYNTHKHTQK